MSVIQGWLKHRILSVVLVSLLCASTADAALQAQLSQNPVYAGDPLTLTLSSDAANTDDQPDLSPLRRDFQILGTATSSQLTVINGKSTSSLQWRVQLQPRHSGQLVIPAIRLGAQHSQPLTVQVTDTPSPAATAAAAATRQHLFVEASVDPATATPYVQQALTYTVRLFYDDSLREGSLAEPQLADAVVERIGEDTHSRETRAGRQYQVIERRYAIIPQKSGELTIPALQFEGRLAADENTRGGRSRQSSLMQQFLQNSPFANDPFFQPDTFGGAFADPGQPVRAFSPAVTVKVRPSPISQGAWLPARGVTLHDSWTDSPPTLRVGEAVSRTLTVVADGLSGSQIPALDLPAVASLRVYREPVENATQTDNGRLIGVSRQTLTYIPDTAGALDVPAVSLAWWDTTKDAATRSQLPLWHLTVAAGAGGQTTPVPPAATSVAPAAAAAPAPAPQDVITATAPQRHWLWLGAGLSVLGLVLGLIFWLRRRTAAPVVPAKVSTDTVPKVQKTSATGRAALLRELKSACDTQDAAAAARTLLLLAALEWPKDTPRNLADLAARLSAGAVAVRVLDRHLYGVAEGQWPADALWAAVRQGLQGQSAQRVADTAGELPPLYPHQA